MYSTAPVPLFAPCSHSSVSVHFVLRGTTGSIAVSFGRTMFKVSLHPSVFHDSAEAPALDFSAASVLQLAHHS